MAASQEHKLFICYSHTDQRYREQFSKFLVGPRVEGMQIFSDAEIKPGARWEEEILKNLRTATAALLLVSQDFMVSPFIQRVELREILEGHIRRGLRLFLVAVRPTNYQGTYLEPFQWARPPDRPLSELTQNDQEQAMVDVCMRIAEQLNHFDAPSAEMTIACLKKIPKLDLPSMYELHAPVGEGEFARCYMAKDLLLDRKVIVKVLNTELSRDSPAYDKYVASAARLNHRNILGVLFSQANKLPHFLVTPALEGPTLDQRISGTDNVPRLSFDEAVECTMRLADALAYAHSKKCVHGRLRPCEVRFDGENQPVLSGFRTLESCLARNGPDNMLSLEDFQYCSPERRLSGVVDAKGDQYLLGLLAYEMISGAPPVRVENWSHLLDSHTIDALLHPPMLKRVVPSCNDAVSDLIMTMLAVDPESRLDSLKDVRPLLEAVLYKSTFDVAKESYRRYAREQPFYKDLYDELFKLIPTIAPMFNGRPMNEQYSVLADALWLLLDFQNRPEQREPTILSGIARTHARYSPKQFDLFEQAVLTAVARHDPGGPQAVDAWRDAMKPGLEYLKARSQEAASATTVIGIRGKQT